MDERRDGTVSERSNDTKRNEGDPRRERGETRGDKPNREPQRESLDRAGSPGRTPGSAEGERSDIEEWLAEDSNESDPRKE
jgi:hypothetical protein